MDVIEVGNRDVSCASLEATWEEKDWVLETSSRFGCEVRRRTVTPPLAIRDFLSNRLHAPPKRREHILGSLLS